MILYAIYDVGRMFQTHTNGYAFGFYLYAAFLEITVNVACGMPRGQNDRSLVFPPVFKTHPTDRFALHKQGIDTALEIDFATRFADLFTHGFNDARQAVGADVGMGVTKDVGVGTMLAKHAKNAFNVSAFLGTRVEFAVGIGSSPTFAKGIVALWINAVFA